MSLFNQSTKLVSAVIAEIADSVGASGDPEMLTRSMRSLNAAILHFNSRARWDWMQTQSPPISLVAPFTVTGVSAVSGQSSALVPTSHGLLVDDLISFTGLPLGTRVSATAAGSIGLFSSIGSSYGTATSTDATAVRDMVSLPSDFKSMYSLKTMSNQFALRPVRRRFKNRVSSTELTPSTPIAYDQFPAGARGKVQIVPPPAYADTLQFNYYRRMTVASATADGTTLDIQQDHEPYLIAYAKWHFIADKGDGRAEQMQTWFTFAEGGLKQMLADQTTVPDEDLMFQPGASSYDVNTGMNSTRYIDWTY